MILWSLAGLPLGIHNILSNQHVALQVQAQLLTGLSLITWAQTMYYGHVSRRCFPGLNNVYRKDLTTLSPCTEMADEEVRVLVGRSRHGVCSYGMCIRFRVQGEQLTFDAAGFRI